MNNGELIALDQSHIGSLISLDLSAASDTVDHQIPNDVLRQIFGLSGSALDRLADFAEDRTQIIRTVDSEMAVLMLE